MSAIAPAGSASSMTGNVVAAATSATIAGELASEVISQPEPTSFIQVPMFETNVASHTARNSRLRSGLHGDGGLKATSLCPPFTPRGIAVAEARGICGPTPAARRAVFFRANREDYGE